MRHAYSRWVQWWKIAKNIYSSSVLKYNFGVLVLYLSKTKLLNLFHLIRFQREKTALKKMQMVFPSTTVMQILGVGSVEINSGWS